MRTQERERHGGLPAWLAAPVTTEALTRLAGVNAAANDEVALALGAAGNRAVAEGDVIAVYSVAIGMGLADPGGVVRVEGSRAQA